MLYYINIYFKTNLKVQIICQQKRITLQKYFFRFLFTIAVEATVTSREVCTERAQTINTRNR